MGTVTKLQTVVWSELAELCQREQRHMADARALWPEIAARMAQLRKDYKSNEEFGIALVQHGIEYNTHDRAAFIWMGSLRRSVLEDAIALCDRKSPKYFRIEVESWVDPYFNLPSLCPDGQNATETTVAADLPETAPVVGESATSPILDDEKTEDRVGDQRWDSRSKLFVLGEDGRLIQALIGGRNARASVYPLFPKHRKFLQFIAAQMRSGRLPHPPAFNSHVFHARRLMPALDQSFAAHMVFMHGDETKPRGKEIALFMERFDLLLVAAEKGWSYTEFVRATKGMTPAARPASAAEVWAQQPQAASSTATLASILFLADGTELTPEPIYVCGKCLFPSEARKDLAYVDAYLHAHDCRQWVSHMSASSVQEVGITLAHRGIEFERQYKALGAFLSAIGTAIRANGESMDRALWFKLEPFHNRTSEK